MRIPGSKIGIAIGNVSKDGMVKGTSNPRISKTKIKRKMARRYL
jgi:hypothetical protein